MEKDWSDLETFTAKGKHNRPLRTEVPEKMKLTKKARRIIEALEAKGFVALYRGKRGNIRLIKATYKGQKKAKPLEYYKWFPKWINKDEIF